LTNDLAGLVDVSIMLTDLPVPGLASNVWVENRARSVPRSCGCKITGLELGKLEGRWKELIHYWWFIVAPANSGGAASHGTD
jgi:hypothetical protein